jgi:hypothetical protein
MENCGVLFILLRFGMYKLRVTGQVARKKLNEHIKNHAYRSFADGLVISSFLCKILHGQVQSARCSLHGNQMRGP